MQKGKPHKKYSQAGRVHDIIRLIESRHGITLEELEQESGVTRRTIHRDLVAIQEAGYPLVSERSCGRKVYRFLIRFKDVPPISFTLQELMTLSFLRSQLDLLQGTPFHDDMETISRKINSVLPPRYAAHMERIAGVSTPLLQGRRDYCKVAEQLAVIRDALLYQKSLLIGYQARGEGEETSYRVDPYSLLFYKGGLYLVGYAHNRAEIRTFAMERVVRAESLKERFELPPDYQPGERLKGSFGIVGEQPMAIRVRFTPVVAHTIRDRIWHPTQVLEQQEDGRVVLAMEAGGKMEIVSWLLSYGAHAEVLEPPELRREMAGIAAEMGRAYGVGD